MTGWKLLGGSCIGGMKETQEMIDFVAKHNITANIEVIPIDYVKTAMERLVKADVKYRFICHWYWEHIKVELLSFGIFSLSFFGFLNISSS